MKNRPNTKGSTLIEKSREIGDAYLPDGSMDSYIRDMKAMERRAFGHLGIVRITNAFGGIEDVIAGSGAHKRYLKRCARKGIQPNQPRPMVE